MLSPSESHNLALLEFFVGPCRRFVYTSPARPFHPLLARKNLRKDMHQLFTTNSSHARGLNRNHDIFTTLKVSTTSHKADTSASPPPPPPPHSSYATNGDTQTRPTDPSPSARPHLPHPHPRSDSRSSACPSDCPYGQHTTSRPPAPPASSP